ncbi:TspO/MBR family protein [Echinicola jeungdonensis]|uniref:TspO/MBR family protein n=1 Tax=Echinicola jeungdonensis TaxID=709343 RepID=A0ABV5J4Q0_9BACT|nr:TspO/MBR family protein [Echinicola jeungdonensis]MDN3668866.1 TspO/MBR family protein [Echinicola jeungdonensis]
MDSTKNHNHKKIHWPRLLMYILGIIMAGSISGLANVGNIQTWYASLEKPIFNPPNSIFGPVWTLLYALMGLGLYMIWESPKSKGRNLALSLFFVQLILNFCWSFIFFYFHQPSWAALEILVLWALILLMINRFYKVNKWAAYLQIPYILWVSFASVLNISIWWLNS